MLCVFSVVVDDVHLPCRWVSAVDVGVDLHLVFKDFDDGVAVEYSVGFFFVCGFVWLWYPFKVSCFR